jgi:hypothetical protein
MHKTNSMVTVINHSYKPDLTDRSVLEKSSMAIMHLSLRETAILKIQ